MHRTPEVIDCWYDSGSMPFAQWHYPFENKEMFEENFPANFISEAIDQTRGWFYTLMAISTLIFDRAPFKNCLVHGPRAGRGRPEDEQASRQRRRSVGRAGQAGRGRGALVLLRRRARRGCPRASPASWSAKCSASSWARCGTPTRSSPCTPPSTTTSLRFRSPRKSDYTLMDKWALSKLNTLVKFVDEGLAELQDHRNRPRHPGFRGRAVQLVCPPEQASASGASEWTGDKKAAYDTLYTVLVTLCEALRAVHSVHGGDRCIRIWSSAISPARRIPCI